MLQGYQQRCEVPGHFSHWSTCLVSLLDSEHAKATWDTLRSILFRRALPGSWWRRSFLGVSTGSWHDSGRVTWELASRVLETLATPSGGRGLLPDLRASRSSDLKAPIRCLKHL